MTVVYLIACGENLCKIGITDDVPTRTATLQGQTPRKLKMLNGVMMPTNKLARRVEKLAHKALADTRLAGTEWFQSPAATCLQRLLEAVDTVRKEWADEGFPFHVRYGARSASDRFDWGPPQ